VILFSSAKVFKIVQSFVSINSPLYMYYCTLSHRVGTDKGMLGLYRLDITKDWGLIRGMKLSPIIIVKV
ncbi:MAG: hypothetical protein KH415_20600, partial [Clostridium sp.]|nr:hypothetical protein [Clostridium sp.]